MVLCPEQSDNHLADDIYDCSFPQMFLISTNIEMDF